MEKRISLLEFKLFVEMATLQYPDAAVSSIGTGTKDGQWSFILFLNDNGAERTIEIPCTIKL